MRQPIVLLALAASIALSGCASRLGGVGGTDSHRCPMPEGGACQSILETYEKSVSGVSGTADQKAPAAAATDAAPSRTPIAFAPGFGEAHHGAPLMTTPRVLRVYIAPWRDSDDNLMDGRRVYTRIDDGRWRVEHFDASVRRDVAAQTAFQPPPQAAAAPAASDAAAAMLPASLGAARAKPDFFNPGAAAAAVPVAPLPDEAMQLPQVPHGFGALVGDDGDDW